MTEFLGLLLLGIIAGAGWLRRKVEEAARERAAQEAAARAPIRRAPATPAAQGRASAPAVSRDSERDWRDSAAGTWDASRGASPSYSQQPRAVWHGSMDGTQESGGAYSGPGDIASEAEQRYPDPAAAFVPADGAPNRRPQAGAVLPRFTRESVVQAVVLNEILSRPRGLRRGRRPAR